MPCGGPFQGQLSGDNPHASASPNITSTELGNVKGALFETSYLLGNPSPHGLRYPNPEARQVSTTVTPHVSASLSQLALGTHAGSPYHKPLRVDSWGELLFGFKRSHAVHDSQLTVHSAINHQGLTVRNELLFGSKWSHLY